MPAFDVQVPLLSLPGLLEATVASVPGRVPYLSAEPGRLDRWKKTLPEGATFRVGIV